MGWGESWGFPSNGKEVKVSEASATRDRSEVQTDGVLPRRSG